MDALRGRLGKSLHAYHTSQRAARIFLMEGNWFTAAQGPSFAKQLHPSPAAALMLTEASFICSSPLCKQLGKVTGWQYSKHSIRAPHTSWKTLRLYDTDNWFDMKSLYQPKFIHEFLMAWQKEYWQVTGWSGLLWLRHSMLDTDAIKPAQNPEVGISCYVCWLHQLIQLKFAHWGVPAMQRFGLTWWQKMVRDYWKECCFKLNANTRHNLWTRLAYLVTVLQHTSAIGLTNAFGDCPPPCKGHIWQSRVPHFCKHRGKRIINIVGSIHGCYYHGFQSNFCYCLPLQHNSNACGRGLIS